MEVTVDRRAHENVFPYASPSAEVAHVREHVTDEDHVLTGEIGKARGRSKPVSKEGRATVRKRTWRQV